MVTGDCTDLLLLDKSALLSLRLADIDRSFGISTALWIEVWTGNPKHRDSCLRAIDQILSRSKLLFSLETLIQNEVFWRRPTPSVIDEEATRIVQHLGVTRLGFERIVEMEENRDKPTRLLWEHAQIFAGEVEDRLRQGDERLASFLRDTNAHRRYQALKDKALPRRIFRYFSEEGRFPMSYDRLDDDWVVRHFCNAMAFVIWDEIRVRRRVHTPRPPGRFRSDYMDIQHMAMAGLVGAIATRDKRMIRRLRVLHSGIEVEG